MFPEDNRTNTVVDQGGIAYLAGSKWQSKSRGLFGIIEKLAADAGVQRCKQCLVFRRYKNFISPGKYTHSSGGVSLKNSKTNKAKLLFPYPRVV